MRGTTHLEGVLDTYYTAWKAAGIPDPFNITFKECVERLIQAAQPHDAILGQNRGRGSQSANFHSILGDESDEEEDSDNEDDLRASLEVFQSDWDRKSGGRKECKKDDRFYKKPGTPTKQRALIPRTKWKTRSGEDQIAWSKISEPAKRTILGNPGHRGTCQSWITNFSETIRQFQALQTDENKLSDQMCVNFLNNSMRGTTHLEGILDTYYTA